MKKTNKILSLLLAVFTICSVLSFSVAAAQTEIDAGSSFETAENIPSFDVSYVSSINQYDEKDWFKFTSSVAGSYSFYFKNYNIPSVQSSTVGFYVYDKYMQKLGSVINGWGEGLAPSVSKTINITLEANITYYIKVCNIGYYGTTCVGNYEIKITAPATEKNLSSISVTKPNKTTYNIGDSLDTSGMVVTAKFSDGSTQNVTDYTVSGFNSSSTGNKTVTVSYTYGGVTKTATFSVTVNSSQRDDTISAPTVTASNVASSGKVKLTWNAVDGAASYKVYRATSKDGTYKLMKTTSSTSYTNTSATAGKTYYYKVKAVAADGTSSKYSSVVTRTCDLPRPVVTTSNIASSGKIKLSWNAVEGATSYKVYRATSQSGTYKLMKTTSSTSYTNTSATAGKTYYYKVKAVCSNSAADSAYSAIKTRTCDLAKPTNVQFYFNSSNKPVVKWSKVDGATSYRVYRATSQNGTYKLMKTTTSTSYTNTSVSHGTTYYYKVKAVCSNSAADSAYSAVVGGYVK